MKRSHLSAAAPPDNRSRVLAVDDDPVTLEVVGAALESAGFDVVTAHSAEDALDHLGRNGVPHLAIVDIRMPGKSGVEFCRELRQFTNLPLIILSSVVDETIVIDSIREFADDYIKKPFNPHELAARVERVLDRTGDLGRLPEPLVEIDERFAVDLVGRKILVDDREEHLTPTEVKILQILVANARRIVPTRELLRRVWPDGEVFEEALRVNIHRLRRKIEPDPATPTYLHTERGIGYTLAAPSPTTAIPTRKGVL